MEKKIVEPLPNNILMTILGVENFTEHRIKNTELFKSFIEMDERKLKDDELGKPESFTDILAWGLAFYTGCFTDDVEANQENFDIASGFYSIVELAEFYLFFINSLMMNDLYIDYMNFRVLPVSFQREFESELFKKLHPFLQMLIKLNAYLEDNIYYGYSVLNCGKPIKEIEKLKEFDFSEYFDGISKIVDEYLVCKDDSSWNEISKDWKKHYKMNIKK